jgi:FixJ family two-component response regulator
MLTGCGSEEIAVQALHKGAIDYMPKDSLSKDIIWGIIKAALETWKIWPAARKREPIHA